MGPLLISLYLIVVSISIGLLSAGFVKRTLNVTEAFSLGFAVILVAGLVFYERTAFEYYAYLLAIFPVALLTWASFGREAAVFRPMQLAFSQSGSSWGSPAIWIGLVALVLVTFLTRLPVSHFLFEIGDAGAYVNSANSLARTGNSTSQFFPLNQILLGLFSSLGGFERTAYGVVFAGLLSVFYAYLLGTVLFEAKIWGVAAAFLVAFNVLAMWFARVPYSETLMLAINFGALSFYVSARKGNAPVLNYVMFGLFVALASINRVTGIVWMLLLTAVAVTMAFQDRQQFRQFLPGATLAVAGYLASVYVALRIGPGYYMEWQVKKFIPFIDSRTDLLVFHFVWFLIAAVAVLLTIKSRRALNQGWAFLARHGGISTMVVFVVVVPLAVLAVSGGEEIMGATFFAKVANGKWPQDAYFLWNYFTPLSFLIFPFGLVYLFRRMNPFTAPYALAVWLFAFLFLIIYYARVTYEMPHDVYLYWDRYFLSEIFLVFVIVLLAGMKVLTQWRWTKVLVAGFVGVYFVYGAAWLSENRARSYLDGAEQVFGWLQEVIPRQGSVIYLHAQYEGRWIFPNLKRSLMIPLTNSFGYTVSRDPSASPFAKDSPISWESVEASLERRHDVYVIRARKFGSGQPLGAAEGISGDLIARRSFSIETKLHSPGQVFGSEYRSYPLHLDIFRIRDDAILPTEVELTGFYSDGMWTNGNARLTGFNRCTESGFTALRVQTGGNHPWRRDPSRIAIAVKINGVPTTGEWLSRTEYIARLSQPLSCIRDVRVTSSTFVPAELGMNEDVRKLGLDIVRLKPEG